MSDHEIFPSEVPENKTFSLFLSMFTWLFGSNWHSRLQEECIWMTLVIQWHFSTCSNITQYYYIISSLLVVYGEGKKEEKKNKTCYCVVRKLGLEYLTHFEVTDNNNRACIHLSLGDFPEFQQQESYLNWFWQGAASRNNAVCQK